eukprot:TRINITY_DN1094_c0_g1_i7.p1 TRINITY_DN1094_c0_g1~~TRINITY_DN1094_c0_g1_i7.p1  ORF type:complete len:140 (+),score=32.87 TRINITY_DN1094_c0_g1_i7:148-567(+)
MALLQALLCTLILVPSVLGAPLGNLRKLSDAADRGAGSCYVINDHGTCTMLLGAANNPDCYSSESACKEARGVCYSNKGGMCVMLQQPADDSTCFSSQALCETNGALLLAETSSSGSCYVINDQGACTMLLGAARAASR